VEPVFFELFTAFGKGKKVSKTPFKRITYKDSMLKYGTDKPDLRNPIEIFDVTEVIKRDDVKLDIFKKLIEKGGVVRAIPAPNTSSKPRSFFDGYNTWAKEEGGKGLGYILLEKNNNKLIGKGPIGKFFSEDAIKELAKRPGIIKERAQLMDIAYKDNTDIEDRTIDSHVKRIRKKFKEVDQNFMGRAKILDTPYGKIVKNLIDEGAQLGVSSRGMGSLKPGRNGISEVQGDFYLATAADIVADPSAPDAFVHGIMEGKEWVWDNGLLKETQIQEYKDKIEKSSRKGRENVLVEAFRDFIAKL